MRTSIRTSILRVLSATALAVAVVGSTGPASAGMRAGGGGGFHGGGGFRGGGFGGFHGGGGHWRGGGGWGWGVGAGLLGLAAGAAIAAAFNAKYPDAKPEHIAAERERLMRAPLVIAAAGPAPRRARLRRALRPRPGRRLRR